MSHVPPEFSRRVQLSRLGAQEAAYPVCAEAAEREALARRFDLLSLDRLEAEIRLRRVGGGMIRLSGEAAAQQLALALEPYPRAPGASLERGGHTAQPSPKRRAGD